MLRIPALAFAALVALEASLAVADIALLGQRSIVTQRAVLPPRALYPRQNDFTCGAATDTLCPDGSGCCPQGAACFSSDGVGLCSVTCQAAQPTCVFNGVTACCPEGDTCGGSLCVPQATGMPILSSMGSSPTTSDSTDTTTTQTTTQVLVATVTSTTRSALSCTTNASCTSTVIVYVSSDSVPSSSSSPPPSSSPLDSSSPSSSGDSSLPTLSVPFGNSTVIQVVNSTTSTTSYLSSTNTFGLSTPSTMPPLQVSIAAAPTNVAAWGVANVIGLAAIGLVL